MTDLREFIRDVPDFPEPGILFKDITPLLRHPEGFGQAVTAMAQPFTDAGVDLVAGIEARGFIFGSPVAQALQAGFVPVRKPGKLPGVTHQVTYGLEYGTATLELHTNAIAPGTRVLVVDDVLATGGTAAAACELVTRCGGVVVGLAFLIELTFLEGRAVLGAADVHAVIPY